MVLIDWSADMRASLWKGRCTARAPSHGRTEPATMGNSAMGRWLGRGGVLIFRTKPNEIINGMVVWQPKQLWLCKEIWDLRYEAGDGGVFEDGVYYPDGSDRSISYEALFDGITLKWVTSSHSLYRVYIIWTISRGGDLQDKIQLFDGSQVNSIVTPIYKDREKRIFEFGVRLDPPHWPSKFENHHVRVKFQNCRRPIEWPIKTCARRALSLWERF